MRVLHPWLSYRDPSPFGLPAYAPVDLSTLSISGLAVPHTQARHWLQTLTLASRPSEGRASLFQQVIYSAESNIAIVDPAQERSWEALCMLTGLARLNSPHVDGKLLCRVVKYSSSYDSYSRRIMQASEPAMNAGVAQSFFWCCRTTETRP
ncbi:hypothetical protein BDU57DRAFT_124947 [Ampelomyces quisqualis]|uniref:Uncharacterized protein n=1 Tax=Ampelomyces quisqualis TaxID=50730 RepID=A0A6A5QU96_AMPQU|nr:hypothetical protein BDU57DRAFT_124947 [Ampelomyces quisqualis]